MRTLFWSWLGTLCAVHVLNLYTFWTRIQLQHPWIDMPLHFFGGVGVGLFALWVGLRTGLIPGLAETLLGIRMRQAFPEGAPWWWSLGCVAIVALLIMLGWEQFEVFLLWWLSLPIPPEYFADTMIDYALGAGGAMAAYAYFRVQWRHG